MDRIDVDRIRIRCGSVYKCGQALRVCEMATVQAFTLPEDVPDRPHHPDAGYKFPKRFFGKKWPGHPL